MNGSVEKRAECGDRRLRFGFKIREHSFAFIPLLFLSEELTVMPIRLQMTTVQPQNLATRGALSIKHEFPAIFHITILVVLFTPSSHDEGHTLRLRTTVDPSFSVPAMERLGSASDGIELPLG
jgi:hypothetical protein